MIPEWFNPSFEWLYKFNDWTNTKVGGWVTVFVILAVVVTVLTLALDEYMPKKRAQLWGYIAIFPLSILRGFAYPLRYFAADGTPLDFPRRMPTLQILNDSIMFAFFGIGTYLLITAAWKNRSQIWKAAKVVIPFVKSR